MEYRVRVVQMLASLKIAVDMESFDMLGLDREDALPLLEALVELNEGADKLAAWLVGEPLLVWHDDKLPAGDNTSGWLSMEQETALRNSSMFSADQLRALALNLDLRGWPMRNVLFICTQMSSTAGSELASQLTQHIQARLHSTSFRDLLAENVKIIPAGVSQTNFKTQLCKNWNCFYGDRCHYAHGEHELQKKLCKGWTQGACRFDKTCFFAQKFI